MRRLTSIDPELLGLLSPEAAVSVLRRLLWAEAAALGIGPALVSVPGSIYAADGGVDAEITDVPIGTLGTLLFPGIVRYQVKTGAFSASSASDKRDLFLKSTDIEFKDRVRTCFEKGGTFVAVLFGSDAVDQTDGYTAEACRDFVGKIQPAFKDCKIVILRQNQIAGFVDRHHSILCSIQGQSFPNLVPHAQWAGELESQNAIQAGPEQIAFLTKVQQELRHGVSRHICIWGEPGVGKTRLLYEATAQDDLAQLVAYFRSPSALETSGVVDELVHNKVRHAIVVVDDCEARDRTDIWNRLKSLGSRVRLITVQHDPFNSSGSTMGIPVPSLAQEQISAIIQQHGIPKDAADRFAPLCGGSPRVAYVLGWNLQHNPQDLTRPLDTGNVWDRYLARTDKAGSPEATQRILVLQHIALFKKFGFGDPFRHEYEAISEQVRNADPSLTPYKFQEIIHHLKQGRILQGETTLYITPRLLHIKLWCDWWAVHGEHFSLEAFLKETPESLHTWFYEMFSYAHGSQAATKAVRAILDTHGTFVRDGLVKTELGANFFFFLTEADTGAALECLEESIGRDSVEQLREFADGRQRIVRALEKIAVERSLFARAATLLLRLAETENNPRIANNATGTFAGLFSLGCNRLAPTQAPPNERFPILRSALYSDSLDQRAVALKACDRALNFSQFSRTIGAERRGLLELDLWSPRTYGEWWDAYESAWKLLADRLPSLPNAEQVDATTILLKHCSDLIRIPKLRNPVIETIASLSHNPAISRKELLRTVLNVLEHSEDLPSEFIERWRGLEMVIVGGDDVQARLRRYVCLPPWEYHKDGELSLVPFEELASQLVKDPRVLEPVLDWLLSPEAESSILFGKKLGETDRDFALLDMIVSALEHVGETANCGLLGGYLLAVREADITRWFSILEALANHSGTNVFVLQLLMIGGLNDGAAGILKRLIKSGVFPASRLRGFIYGGQVRRVSVPVFTSWIDLLLADGTQDTVGAALELIQSYIHGRGNEVALPLDLVESVLCHNALFAHENEQTHGAHLDYDWGEVARWLLGRRPERWLVLARVLLESMGRDGLVLRRFGETFAHKLLFDIAKSHPSGVWAIAAPLLGPPIDARAFSIGSWLQGGVFKFDDASDSESVLSHVLLTDLWRWVDDDIERRASYLARFAPKNLVAVDGRPSLFREIIIRYGDREDVRRSLLGSYFTGGWMGPESAHYQGQKDRLDQFLERELEPQVRRWLTDCIQMLEGRTSRARIVEERESF